MIFLVPKYCSDFIIKKTDPTTIFFYYYLKLFHASQILMVHTNLSTKNPTRFRKALAYVKLYYFLR